MEQKITGVYVIFVHERAMFLAEMISFVVNLSSLARDGQHQVRNLSGQSDVLPAGFGRKQVHKDR